MSLLRFSYPAKLQGGQNRLHPATAWAPRAYDFAHAAWLRRRGAHPTDTREPVLATHLRPEPSTRLQKRIPRTKRREAERRKALLLPDRIERMRQRAFVPPSPSPACGGGLGRGRARLSAPHRGSCLGDLTPPLSSGPRFLVHRMITGLRPSPAPMQRAPRRPVMTPAGTMPKAARYAIVQPRAVPSIARCRSRPCAAAANRRRVRAGP